MNYEDFVCYVQQKIQKVLGEEVQVHLHQIIKNNAVCMEGLSILENNQNISPTIYLKEYYEQYERGMTIPEVTEHILAVYDKSRIRVPLSTEFYTVYENVKERVACKVINFEKNRELLRKVPYVQYLDLAVVFYYLMRSEALGTGTILIYNNHLDMWKITKEELYETARKNTPCMLPFDFKGMEEIIEGMDECETEEEFGDMITSEGINPVPMYVLTNTEKMLGAACILYDSILTRIGERLKDDFYILPSSIHECIVVPGTIPASREELKDMVREINQTQVKPEEILSDAVYYYNRKIHSLSL